jgi:hypothetical protein
MGCACEAEAVARERCLLTNSGDYAFRRRRSDDRTSVAEISSRCESFPTVADEEGKDSEMRADGRHFVAVDFAVKSDKAWRGQTGGLVRDGRRALRPNFHLNLIA